MEQEEVRPGWSQFPSEALHVVEDVHLLLDEALVDAVRRGVEHLGARWRGFVLALACLVVVEIDHSFVIDLMVKVAHGVGEGIQIFLGVLLAHEGVVFFFLKPDFDGDSAPVEERLTVEVLNREQGALLSFVVDEGPVLSFLQPDGLYLTKYGKNFE